MKKNMKDRTLKFLDYPFFLNPKSISEQKWGLRCYPQVQCRGGKISKVYVEEPSQKWSDVHSVIHDGTTRMSSSAFGGDSFNDAGLHLQESYTKPEKQEPLG